MDGHCREDAATGGREGWERTTAGGRWSPATTTPPAGTDPAAAGEMAGDAERLWATARDHGDGRPRLDDWAARWTGGLDLGGFRLLGVAGFR